RIDTSGLPISSGGATSSPQGQCRSRWAQKYRPPMIHSPDMNSGQKNTKLSITSAVNSAAAPSGRPSIRQSTSRANRRSVMVGIPVGGEPGADGLQVGMVRGEIIRVVAEVAGAADLQLVHPVHQLPGGNGPVIAIPAPVHCLKLEQHSVPRARMGQRGSDQPVQP